ncbi:protein phosphatase 2C domain-containing protein [Nocardioides sp. cx-169]|uniref:protein phosphatase 2C domain-containing protein n=1 Tax=Nocardioides sp. cx-169 TaxID=2899080 RepID=UPI001E4CB263|nr:protein phosphatase 2C domain-containing protein [Nocardioides sp. cx-169]MCD4532574.1 protein phosphatase 2C domain-containing protein [Nocardioides sp. cx-169]
MRFVSATSRGHGRPNEDFVGGVPGAAVLLDGAGVRGSEAICRHGVAWYSHRLGASLLARLARDDETSLVAALADAIDEVAGQHRDTCDIANPSSPQSTVSIVRFRGDRADFLVLGDVYVVLDLIDGLPQVVTDTREVSVRRECTAALHGVPAGTREHDQRKQSVIDALRARRNQPGGYWIAKDDPRAAMEAVTGWVPIEQLRGAALLSNGASRIVDPYQLCEWPTVLQLIRADGPHEILRRIREAEAAGAGSREGVGEPDDATIAYCDLVERGSIGE